ncbi:MAG TPA: BTAD domain-containing putative transcriptional regulator, partial [Gemmatimonas sp.]|nr:BTAD domain-containing putative transcriptional regulator [Gemmatimonas sp.]
MSRASAGATPAGPALLRVLGGLEFDGATTGAAAELLARPKQLALLVYLALGGRMGLRQRGTVLELFWPESTSKRARSSLRQAAYQLRQLLGPDVLAGRGDAVGLSADALRCDAVDFDRRLDTGDRAGALELYRGDLLPGFAVDGAPDFDQWLDEQRRHFRERALTAARMLAEEAEGAGDISAARDWSRRAIEIMPDDEPSVRMLITQLERSGDRTGALRAFDDFAQRMRDFDVEPSDETSSLVSGLRTGTAPDAPVTLDPRRVLVTAFDDDTSGTALPAFGRLLADTIGQRISEQLGLQVVPLTALLSSERRADEEATQLRGIARARVMAADAGAGTIITGAYYMAEHQLMVQGWIADARDGRVLGTIGPVSVPGDRPLSSIAAVCDDVCTRLALHFETRVMHLRAASRAPTYEAHAAYHEGMQYFVRADWRGALDALGRAVHSDTSYVLPHIVSAIARWNLGELPEAQDAVARARLLIASAGPFERATLEMVRAWLAGDWAAAYDATRRQTELAPASISAFGMAEEARRRNRPREALRLLQGLDPARGEMCGWVYYWVVMTQSLHMLGEHARELDMAHKARALHPESASALRLELHARAALGDVPG